MSELDLHGMRATEALAALVSRYNRLVASGQRRLLVVHGYGSSGVGGDLRRRVRNFLRSAKVEFITQKDNSLYNKGQTLVVVGKSVLFEGCELEEKILDYCRVAKTKEKIFSKFHKKGQGAIRQAFVSLQRKGLLKEKQKGRFKVYQTSC